MLTFVGVGEAVRTIALAVGVMVYRSATTSDPAEGALLIAAGGQGEYLEHTKSKSQNLLIQAIVRPSVIILQKSSRGDLGGRNLAGTASSGHPWRQASVEGHAGRWTVVVLVCERVAGSSRSSRILGDVTVLETARVAPGG